jgi:hypothetical protein
MNCQRGESKHGHQQRTKNMFGQDPATLHLFFEVKEIDNQVASLVLLLSSSWVLY